MLYMDDELDRQGDWTDALQAYEAALTLEPDSFGPAVKRAVLLYRLGRTDEAGELLTALRGRATTATMLNNLCWEKATAGVLLDSALDECNAALQLKPDAAAYL